MLSSWLVVSIFFLLGAYNSCLNWSWSPNLLAWSHYLSSYLDSVSLQHPVLLEAEMAGKSGGTAVPVADRQCWQRETPDLSVLRQSLNEIFQHYKNSTDSFRKSWELFCRQALHSGTDLAPLLLDYLVSTPSPKTLKVVGKTVNFFLMAAT